MDRFIYNNGTLTLNGSVSLQNSGNILSNCSPTSRLISTSTFQNTGDGTLVNNGLCTFTSIILQGGFSNQLCLGLNSQLIASSFTNGSSNTVTAPNGQACINVSTSFARNADLTLFSDVYLCLGNGITLSGSSGFGNATVSMNCSDCSVPLTVDLLHFSINVEPDKTILLWSTASEINSSYFVVERSIDGYFFQEIDQIQGAGTTSSTSNYQIFDDQPVSGISYYRLKQVDFDGTTEYFNTIAAYRNSQEEFTVFPNPTSNSQLNIQFNSERNAGIASLQILDLLGQQVLSKQLQIQEGIQVFVVDVSGLLSGSYSLKISCAGGIIEYTNFVVK